MSLAISQRNGLGNRMMALSLNRLNRKGSTAAGLSGPPRLNSTTARRFMGSSAPPATHYLDEFAHMFGRRFRQDAVPQIENQGAPPEGFEDALDFAPHRLAAHGKQDRIEIALKCDMGLQLCRGPGERQVV